MFAKPGDWQCPGCGDHQFARNPFCRRCNTPRPLGMIPGMGRPRVAEFGDWDCPRCGDLQFSRNDACRKCGTSRRAMIAETEMAAQFAPALRQAASSIGLQDWVCPKCSDVQFRRNPFCRQCKTPRPPELSAMMLESGRLVPGALATPRGDPATPHSLMAPQRAAQVGDWYCPKCGNLHFAQSMVCQLCSTPKPENAQAFFATPSTAKEEAKPLRDKEKTSMAAREMEMTEEEQTEREKRRAAREKDREREENAKREAVSVVSAFDKKGSKRRRKQMLEAAEAALREAESEFGEEALGLKVLASKASSGVKGKSASAATELNQLLNAPASDTTELADLDNLFSGLAADIGPDELAAARKAGAGAYRIQRKAAEMVVDEEEDEEEEEAKEDPVNAPRAVDANSAERSTWLQDIFSIYTPPAQEEKKPEKPKFVRQVVRPRNNSGPTTKAGSTVPPPVWPSYPSEELRPPTDEQLPPFPREAMLNGSQLSADAWGGTDLISFDMGESWPSMPGVPPRLNFGLQPPGPGAAGFPGSTQQLGASSVPQFGLPVETASWHCTTCGYLHAGSIVFSTNCQQCGSLQPVQPMQLAQGEWHQAPMFAVPGPQMVGPRPSLVPVSPFAPTMQLAQVPQVSVSTAGRDDSSSDEEGVSIFEAARLAQVQKSAAQAAPLVPMPVPPDPAFGVPAVDQPSGASPADVAQDAILGAMKVAKAARAAKDAQAAFQAAVSEAKPKDE